MQAALALLILFSSCLTQAATRLDLSNSMIVEVNAKGTVYVSYEPRNRPLSPRRMRISKIRDAKEIFFHENELYMLDKDNRLWRFDKSLANFRINRAIIITRNWAILTGAVIVPVMLPLVYEGVVSAPTDMHEIKDFVVWLGLLAVYLYEAATLPTAEFASLGGGSNYFTIPTADNFDLLSNRGRPKEECGLLLRDRLFKRPTD